MVLGHFFAIMRNPAILKHEDAVGEIENPIVMCHDDAGAVFGNGNIMKQVHYAAARFGVERRSGLVANDQARFMHQRAGDRDALLLPT